MVDAGRQHRPGDRTAHRGDCRAGLRRAGVGELQHLRAGIEAEPRAALDQRRELRLVGGHVLAGQRVGEELDDEQQVLPREVLDALADDRHVVAVGVRMVGAQIDHDLAAGAAELAHLPGVDAGGKTGQIVSLGVGIVARRVEPDQQRHVARQHAVVDDARHRADRVEQHARRLACEVAHDVRLGVAQHGVADLCPFVGRVRENLADAAALIAGDHHDRAVPAADLLVATQFGCRQMGHAASLDELCMP